MVPAYPCFPGKEAIKRATVVVDLIKLSVVALMPRVLFAAAGCCSLPLGAQLARHTPALET